MFAEQFKQSKNKPDFKKLKNPIDDLILFLENCLEEFPQIYKKHFKSNNYKQEPEVSALFSKLLEYNCRKNEKPYIFTHQYPQYSKSNKIGKKRDVDIEVSLYVQTYFDSKTFFAIECKWLRLPPSKSEQYVSGNTGGIERFKRELHGIGLGQSAIIGFIEKENFEFWFNSINTWITTLCNNNNDSIKWEESDLLKEVKISEETAIYTSKNKRKFDYIKIHHLWVYMFNDNISKE